MEQDADLYPTTFNQDARCEWISRNPGVLPPEISAVRFTGVLDERILEEAIASLTQRHESLRTNFPLIGGQRWQRVARHLRPVLEAHRLPQLEQSALDETLRAAFAAAFARPFDIENDILLRPILFVLSDTDHIVALSIEHNLVDGESIKVLWEDLLGLYAHLKYGLPYDTSLPSYQLRDFAAWQRRRYSGPLLESLLGFWQRNLAELPPPITWDTEHPRPPRFTYRSRQMRWRAGPEATLRLRGLAKAGQTTLSTALTAMLARVVQLSGDQDDFLVKTMLANRRQPQLARLIGFLSNAVILRFRLAGCDDFADVLRRVRDTNVAAYAYGELPNAMVVPLVPALPGGSYSRRPQISYMHRAYKPLNVPPMPDVSFARFAIDAGRSDGAWTYDLVLITEECGEEIEFSLWYNEDIFDPAALARLVERFKELAAPR